MINPITSTLSTPQYHPVAAPTQQNKPQAAAAPQDTVHISGAGGDADHDGDSR